MAGPTITSKLTREIERFVKEGFSPRFGQLKETFKSNLSWQRLGQLGTDLWLDSGSIGDVQPLWTREFSALTTNNTLLNKEIQTGQYDSLISEVARTLAAHAELSERERLLEIAFVLNAWHALRLVEKFDAFVSVEEHTDLAHDVQPAIDYARRYFHICPERFLIKIPFTPAGLLATRRLSREGIPVNHTLGFSARQNYVMARIGKPAFVNVFLGRLNSFVADNDLGDGRYVGEKATLASQRVIRQLREKGLTTSRQIGASFREGSQVRDLAGIDVMTIPPKVAAQFLQMQLDPDEIVDRTAADYRLGVQESVDREAIRLNTLWHVSGELVTCLDALEKEDLDSFTPDDLIDFFSQHGCGDIFVRWTNSQIETSAREGKIPKLDHWKEALESKAIGLDSLMNLAGLNSFAADQKEMDDRVIRATA
jgi:transaldolase